MAASPRRHASREVRRHHRAEEKRRGIERAMPLCVCTGGRGRLPPSAGQTLGNNVDAYADDDTPDGFSTGDLRASITSLSGKGGGICRIAGTTTRCLQLPSSRLR